VTSTDATGAAHPGHSSLRLPDSLVGYLANDFAVITGVIHLLLAPQVLGFSQELGVLFALNGLGFFFGVGVYLSDYWRREFYLVAAGYAAVTFLAFFFYGGFEGFVSAFVTRGSLNWNAVGAKTAEVGLAACAVYRYATSDG
jgi:hypothetical protein